MKIFAFIFFITLTFSQTWDNHPELNWKSFETENFIFYFHDGTQRSALEASKVAEIIYDPITSLYDFYPKSKTAVILKDTDDYSNGVAMFYDNKIEIWTKPMDFDLRGNHRWIQDVLTHEFVHIVQLGASKKFSDNLPAIYLQIIDYEDERREDVLYGYPNRIISIPVPGTSVPPWFAEGVAQYMYDDVYYDFWDSHRDMVLRDAVLNDNLLTYNEMSTFGKKGIGNEIFGFQQTDIIEAWIPLFLFCVVFGLSMDYHVFLLSRVKEFYNKTKDNTLAVSYGLSSTATIITGAGLIMVAVFGGFALGEMLMMQQIGFGLLVAILLDSTIIRIILVPASMKLLGEYNWYMPKWLEWLPTVKFEAEN